MNGGSAEDGVDTALLESLIAPLREDPDHSAILTDVDGTIAPIVADPAEAGGARGDAGVCCGRWPSATPWSAA